MTKLVYYIFYLISLLPFRVLYALSDMGYLLIFRLIGYRKDVVRKNLTESFPEKDINEIKDIERKFYHWLCDYFLEAIKLLSISEKELRRRFTIVNAEEIEACMKEGQDCAAILGHYCNWEWLSTVGIAFPANRVMGLIYKPLHSKHMDYVFRRLRTAMPGGVAVPKNQILRYLVRFRKENTRTLFGYIADQGPRWDDIHLWLPFLNHDTGVFTGAERLMRKMNNAVFFVEMQRPRRGYYTCTFRLITREPNALPEFELTRRFFTLLEECIRRNPQYYLWTHNRWKRTHEEFDRRFKVEHGRVVEKS